MDSKENYRTVLLTGASSGIGYELGRLFAQDNFSMIIVARNLEKLREAAEVYRRLGAANVSIITKDLSKPGNAQELYEEVKVRGYQVDILVNDAGKGEYGDFVNTSLEEELSIIQLNVCALVVLTKLFLRDMVTNNHGKILQLASISSYQPTPRLAIYAATKAFVLSFTDAVAYEVKDTHVTLTALIPGPTDTDFFEEAGMEDTKAAQDPEDPGVVAKAGYEALMKDKPHALAPGMRREILMSLLMPNRAVAAKARKLMKHTEDSAGDGTGDVNASVH